MNVYKPFFPAMSEINSYSTRKWHICWEMCKQQHFKSTCVYWQYEYLQAMEHAINDHLIQKGAYSMDVNENMASKKKI